MSAPRSVPVNTPIDNPTFTVKSKGNEITGEYLVMSVVVLRSANRVSGAQIVLYDGSPDKENFEISSTDAFSPNTPIEIEAGYHTENVTIFKGLVVKHAIKIYRNKPSILIVDCKHEAFKLTVGRKNAYFYKKKDSDIIKDLAGASGASATVKATKVTHEEMVQFYATDWDFIVSRAEANGMFVFTEDGKIKVEPPDFAGSPVYNLQHGATIMEMEAEIDARTQYKGVTASIWDAKTQKMKDLKGADPSVVSPGDQDSATLAKAVGLASYDIVHGGQLKDPEVQQWADAQLLKSHLAKIRGRVKFQGVNDILPGQMIELSGLGDKFNGKAFISAVRHEISQSNWETDVTFGLDPEWFSRQFEDILTKPAEGLLPAVHGLQIGVVTKLEKDPDGEDRVRVRIPMIDPAGEGVWARVANVDAGKERGFFFRPEINDEVVLGFLQDDPRNPIILGQMHSSKNPAPIVVKDTNHEKGIFTREKLKLLFNDEDKIITLETPGGNTLVMDDKEGAIVITDSNGNSITLNKDGVTIDSAKDLILKAAAEVKAESGANFGIKAGAQLKAEGSAGAELSTGAIATIKGSMVKIN